MTIDTLLRQAPLLILAACAAALGTGLTAQFGFGLQPCALCYYQRVPYALSGVLMLIALVPAARPARSVLLGIAALAFAVNAGIAVFHTGVERHWWAGLAACEGDAGPMPDSPEALLEALKGPPPARCDDIPFEIMGVTMANANVPASAALAVFAAAAAFGRKRRRAS